MDNLLSYCGLVDARIRASDKDLPVTLAKAKSLFYSLVGVARVGFRISKLSLGSQYIWKLDFQMPKLELNFSMDSNVKYMTYSLKC